MQGSFTLSARVVSVNMEAREREYARSRAGIWTLARADRYKNVSNREKVGRDTHVVGADKPCSQENSSSNSSLRRCSMGFFRFISWYCSIRL